MEPDAISQYITTTFDAVHVAEDDGNWFFIYDPEHNTHQFPFATLVSSNRYDEVSNLDRPSVFRLNLGISKDTFAALFGAEKPDSPIDFTVLDRLLPHPVYGNMHWVCVLNPSTRTFEQVCELLAESYAISVRSVSRRS